MSIERKSQFNVNNIRNNSLLHKSTLKLFVSFPYDHLPTETLLYWSIKVCTVGLKYSLSTFLLNLPRLTLLCPIISFTQSCFIITAKSLMEIQFVSADLGVFGCNTKRSLVFEIIKFSLFGLPCATVDYQKEKYFLSYVF